MDDTLKNYYLKHAAYYFYKADGKLDTIVSAAHRSKAAALVVRLIEAGEDLPSASEVREYAVTIFPPGRVHEG